MKRPMSELKAEELFKVFWGDGPPTWDITAYEASWSRLAQYIRDNFGGFVPDWESVNAEVTELKIYAYDQNGCQYEHLADYIRPTLSKKMVRKSNEELFSEAVNKIGVERMAVEFVGRQKELRDICIEHGVDLEKEV